MKRQYFFDTISHKKPEHLLVDFGRCPLSYAETGVVPKLMEFLGFSDPIKETSVADTFPIPEKLLTHYDIDTRGVGTIWSLKKKGTPFLTCPTTFSARRINSSSVSASNRTDRHLIKSSRSVASSIR